VQILRHLDVWWQRLEHRTSDEGALMAVAQAAHYPIRVVARMTGLSVDTLRAWERRYDAVSPVRGDRGRVYTDGHVHRLKQLATLVEQGHPIGRIAGLSDAALKKLRQDLPGQVEVPRDRDTDLGPLLNAVKRYELTTIDSLLNRYAVTVPPEQLIFAVVLPVLREVGARWESGTVRPAQEHLVSSVIRSVLGGLLRTMPRASAGPTMLFATPSGERHELGLLCAAVLAAAAGARVVYLGPDLPAADILHAATTCGADVVVMAATATGASAPDQLSKLARLPKKMAVWLGGRASQPLRDTFGTRALSIDRLEDLSGLIARHVA
jgi:MerR family transcriptional regulator, light-induced transcriptional regulator